jgi:antitoxin (DNA-binding transcriptional repressor) of toxin-antitoxin stability system
LGATFRETEFAVCSNLFRILHDLKPLGGTARALPDHLRDRRCPRYLAKLVNLWYADAVTPSFSIGEAKTNLSKLVALAERGERVELRRGRQPVAQVVALPRPGVARRKPGALAGRIAIGEDFDAWPAEIERALGIRD